MFTGYLGLLHLNGDVYVVQFQEEANGMLKKASKVVAGIIAGRNSAFSGQIFSCLS